MSSLRAVGAGRDTSPLQSLIRSKSGSFVGRAVNWIKRAWDQTDYQRTRMDRANSLFDKLRSDPKYQGRLANMTAPDLQAEFRTTRPFAAIASAIKEWADERASILTALEENPNLDLSPGDR